MANTRTEQLKKIMWDYNLSAGDVAGMLDRTAQTVRCWRCDSSKRTIPEYALLVLKQKIVKRKRAVAPFKSTNNEKTI